MSELEDQLVLGLRAAGLPEPLRQYRFCERRWRFDLAWPQHALAVEVEGGVWAGGRHVRGAGYEGDCEKYNTAVILGWRVLRFTGSMVRDGRALETIRRFMEVHGCISRSTE